MSKKKTELPDLPKKKMGRPSLLSLNPELAELVSGYIRDGLYMEQACLLADIDSKDYWRIMRRAELGDPSSMRFCRIVKKAEAEAEKTATAKMRDDPKAFLGNATFLERRFRDRWGRSDRRTIDSNVNITIASVNYNQLLKQINRKAIEDKD